MVTDDDNDEACRQLSRERKAQVYLGVPKGLDDFYCGEEDKVYKYETEKPNILTDEGQRMFLSIRDRVKAKIENAGAVRMQEAIAGESGSSWKMMACVDRLVELGELQELTNGSMPGQYRVFVEGYK